MKITVAISHLADMLDRGSGYIMIVFVEFR
jgi:hypothetical protein